MEIDPRGSALDDSTSQESHDQFDRHGPLHDLPLVEAYIHRSPKKMNVQLPPATYRKRALPQGELEAAATLKLGADQHTHTLSLSEARLVIHKVLENKRRGGNKYEEPEYVHT